MLVFTYLVSALPLAAAHLIGHRPEETFCGTKTVTCTKPTTVTTGEPATSTCVKWSGCTTTVTKPNPGCETTWVTKTTKTFTVQPTKVHTITSFTKTYTSKKCVATTTSCLNKKWKKDEVPEELSNAERIKLGLPLRSPSEEKRHWGQWGGGNTCYPTTTTATQWTTKTIRPTVTTTSLKCTRTSTSLLPATKTITYTRNECATVTGPPITKTSTCYGPTYVTVPVTATAWKWCY